MAIRLAKLEKAQRQRPELPLFARLADLYLQRGLTRKALDLCQQGCAEFPDYPPGHLVLSRCLEAQQDFQAARKALARALRLDGQNPAAFKRLAAIYEHLGDTDLASRALQQAGRLDPLDERIIAQLDELDYARRRETVVPTPVPYDELPEKSDILAAQQPPEPVASSPETPLPVAPESEVHDALQDAATAGDLAATQTPASLTAAEPAMRTAEDAQQPSAAQADGTAAQMPASSPAASTDAGGTADAQTDQANEAMDADIASLGIHLFGEEDPPTTTAAFPESEELETATPPDPAPESPDADASDLSRSTDSLSGLDPRDDSELVRALHEIQSAPAADSAKPAMAEPEPEVEPEPLEAAQTLPSVSIEPHAAISVSVTEEADAEPAAAPIATATLAEIYRLQGIPQRAAKIYQQLLLQDPDNAELKNRLAELRRPDGAGDSQKQQEAH